MTEEHLASPQQESAQDQAPEEATLTGMTKDTSLNGQVVQVSRGAPFLTDLSAI